MARRIEPILEGWRVRLDSGEWELKLDELKDWVVTGRVDQGAMVLDPVTRRWTRAENIGELGLVFQRLAAEEAARIRRIEDKLAEARRQAHAKRLRIHNWMVRLGFLLLIGGPVLAIVVRNGWWVLAAPVGFLLLFVAVSFFPVK